MKKSILFLTLIVTALFMTSCLGEVSNNYSDTTFVYIESDDVGTVFGKTFSIYSPARIITSSNMAMMMPGTFKIMSYSWDEQNGTKPLSVGGQTINADLVSTGGSSLKAVEAIRSNGSDVLGMIAIFTYGFQHSVDAMHEARVELTTLCNYDAILDEALATDYIDESELKTLQDWRKDPENWGKPHKNIK
jgi:orotate phosphoribosyltransferase